MIGLAVGISASLLISVYIMDELSFDRFHLKSDRIYRLTNVMHLPVEDRAQAMTSPSMGQWLRDNFPEVASTVRIGSSERTLSYKEIRIHNTEIWYADSTLFDIFTFPMLKGNPKTALVEPYSIVLSETSARKFFGNDDPLGKTMTFSDTMSLKVTGVIADIPTNSHLQMDVILSRSTVVTMWRNPGYDKEWYFNVLYTYVLLNEGQSREALESKIKPVLDRQMAIEQKANGVTTTYDFFLQPLTDIHLRSHLHNELGVNGDIKYIYTFIAVAILVLLIACANYINLSTARSIIRSKEVGMRKVAGANRKQLITQLLGESVLMTGFSFVVALAIAYFTLPSFNVLTAKSITLQSFSQPEILAIVISIFLLVSVFAGSYPALFMSSFSPLKVLQNRVRSSTANMLLRKGLVIFQFSISIILIISVLVIFKQLHYIQNQNIGLNKDQVLEVKVLLPIQPKGALIKEQFLKIPGVVSATTTDFSYSLPINSFQIKPEETEENEYNNESAISVDPDFIRTFDMTILAGRNFSPIVTDEERLNFIINEALVKQFGWKSPELAIGKKIYFPDNFSGTVVGVVRDFNYASLRENVKPLMMHLFNFPRTIMIKIESNNVRETINQLEQVWNSVQSEFPFDYIFLDDSFRKLYRAEEQTQAIIGMLSGLAIFIACLGLFGLSAFMAEQRTKEIGIRKVLGAGAVSITRLLSRDFLLLIVVSILIAIPIAWYALNNWLESFAYRTMMPWWIFVIAGGFAFLIALLTVSYQSVKAAVRNPIDSLRSE